MADSQKLTALKKAYAEIILNTAKEAAARIMASERKALRYQQELFAAKDESLRMLLRLKQMLDAKANESETMSFNQQKRIEELEAQLGEAEDIVRDLRAELREAHDELEKLPKDSLHCMGEQKSKDDVATSVILSQESTINDVLFVRSLPKAQTKLVTVSDIKNSVLTSSNEGNKSSCKDNCYVCNPEFASIVMRRKEPGQYRNGCTHRIRALERCLLNDNSSLSGQVDDVKNENTQEGEEGKAMHMKPSMRADISGPEEKTEELNLRQTDDNIIQVHPLSSFLGKRKRAVRYKRNRAPSSMNTLDHVVTVCQEPYLLCSESSSQAADDNAQSGKGSRIIEHDSQKGPHSPITNSSSAAAKVITESESGDPSCKTDLEMVDVSAVNLDVKVSEITERSSPQPANNKFIVYTFKRKRKKDTLSSPDRDCSCDDDISNRKIQEKQNGFLDSEKSTLTTESSQDSLGLAQVACQLISLSEKSR